MALFVFLFFLVFPIAEVMLLGRVIARFGFWDTMVLLIFSGIFGSYLAKLQGRAAFMRVQQVLAEGRMPTAEMIDGVMIFLGGVLFIIPGFLSDILGIFLLFPVTRWLLKWIFLRNLQAAFKIRSTARAASSSSEANSSFSQGRGPIQDAEIVE